ncbi:hypothetical protein BH11CYA1_BH11CYA1_37870 [soil metagenome]
MDTEPVFVKQDTLIDRAFIETPCPTTWDKMKGSDSVRFCNLCHLNVYNIAQLTDKEAEAVLSKGKAGGRVCALLYRRPDGTVVTDNCPRSLRKIRDASKWFQAKIIAATTLAIAFLTPAQAQNQTGGANTNQKSCASPKTGKIQVKASETKASETKSTENKPADTKSVETKSGAALPRPDIPPPGGIGFHPSATDEYIAKVFVAINNAGKKNGLVAPFPSVKFTVKADGTLENIAIKESSGNNEKDKAALTSVKEAAPFARPPATSALPLKLEHRFTQERL